MRYCSVLSTNKPGQCWVNIIFAYFEEILRTNPLYSQALLFRALMFKSGVSEVVLKDKCQIFAFISCLDSKFLGYWECSFYFISEEIVDKLRTYLLPWFILMTLKVLLLPCFVQYILHRFSNMYSFILIFLSVQHAWNKHFNE